MKKIVLTAVVGGLALLIAVSLTQKTPEPSEKWQRLIGSTLDKQPKPEFPGEAAAFIAEYQETFSATAPSVLRQQAVDGLVAVEAARGGAVLPNLTFEEFGPGNYGGRIRAIVVDPLDPDTIVIGSVSGGVWKTEDGGINWRPIDDFLPTLAVGSMYLDPNNVNRIYMGTGEGFFNVDAAQGNGIFVSNDFGETWTQLPFTNNNIDFLYVNRIAVNPDGSIVAATRRGIFRSTNEGADWTRTDGQVLASRGFVDVRVDPSQDGRMYAYHYGGITSRYVARSTDSGASWTRLGDDEGIPTTNIGRMEIGVGTDGVVYLSVANGSDATRGLYRSEPGGNNFVRAASNTAFIERQGWYDLPIGVDPENSDRVFMGAVDVFRTTNAGATITRITDWSPASTQLAGYVHADIHNFAFHPEDSQIFWVVTDGGVFKSTDGGDSFVSLNNNLRITQYYGFDIDPEGRQVIGGTQDNGTHLFSGEDKVNWWQWAGGDGGFCSWDQQDPNFIYGSTPAGGMYGSNDRGNSVTGLNVGLTGAAFIQPFTIDPNNGNRMMAGGSTVRYTENLRQLGAATWVNASGNLGDVRALTFSPHSSSVAFAGTTAGRVYRSDNLDSGSPSFGGFLLDETGINTWVEVDITDNTGNTVYATFSGYDDDRIYRSKDGGDTWESIHGNLPNIPAFCVSVDPNDANRLYLATELGLFTASVAARGADFSWERFNYGPAFTRIQQIRWRGDTMFVTTHGRGHYKAFPQSAELTFETLLDPDCDMDGILDNGETATLPITVTNTGGVVMGSVSVTLSSDVAELVIDTPTQGLNNLAPGASATLDFTVELTALNACLSNAELTAAVNADGVIYDVLQTIELGANPTIMTGTFTEGGEGDTLFTSNAEIGVDDWGTVTTQARSGSRSWFTTDNAQVEMKSLVSPPLTVESAASELSFWVFYDTEADEGGGFQAWDGAVLELRVGDGDWSYVSSSLPYDGLLFTNSPLALLGAWSGDQQTWREGVLALGDYVGETIQFRFRFASDRAVGDVGFWVDDISVTNVSWTAASTCDDEVCLSCFDNIDAALADIYNQLGNGNWPGSSNILNFVDILNNVCLP